jgi:NAD+ synthase (glutamine-hydrolysing)
MAAVVGFPEADRDLYNSGAGARARRGAGHLPQALACPNYAVFDEERYFEPWPTDGPLFVIGGVRVAVTICEDAWSPSGPILTQAAAGAELVVNINASPYYADALREREAMLATRAADASVPLVYVNLVGGQDELVFDGASMVFDESGELVARGHQFTEDLLVVDVDVRPAFRRRALDPRGRRRAPALPEVLVSASPPTAPAQQPRIEPVLEPVREVYEALVVGTRDYVTKNGFADVLIGLSGGIDSSLGRGHRGRRARRRARGRRAHALSLLERGSVADAEALAEQLGIGTLTIPDRACARGLPGNAGRAVHRPRAGTRRGEPPGPGRGTILMTLSNKFDWLVLTTGNKSEMATGYSTLYGDMAVGSRSSRTCRRCSCTRCAATAINAPDVRSSPRPCWRSRPVPSSARTSATATRLPDYAELDPILEGYVEEDQSIADLVAEGHDAATGRACGAPRRPQRVQATSGATGVRVSPKAFGKDRRLPLTNRWPG